MVDVHRDDQAGRPVGAAREGQRLAVGHAHSARRVQEPKVNVGEGHHSHDEVAQGVQQEPTAARVLAQRRADCIVHHHQWQQAH